VVPARFFCDDFDFGGSDLATRWTTYSASTGPALFDLSVFRSAPRALRFPVSGEITASASTLFKNLPVAAGALQLDFDLNIASGLFGPEGILNFATVRMNPPPAGLALHQVSLGFNARGTYLDYYRSDANGLTKLGSPFAPGWRHITVRISFRMLPAVAAVFIDGAPALELPLGGESFSAAEFGLGSTYARDVSAPFGLTYDNVEAFQR
jgi:hypothetical protein